MKKKWVSFFQFLAVFFLTFFSNDVHAKDADLGGEFDQGVGREPLFVSLGSYCITANMHRECGIRKAAFPFDWIVSFDGEKLIELLEEDFLYFLNEDYLKVQGGSLLNTHYHLEFLNEGDWEAAGRNIKDFLPKCKRRIDRFRKLANYEGEVFFVRTANLHSFTDSNRIWKIKENIEITREYGERLYAALKQYFPKLNFNLVIVNQYDRPGFEMEGEFSDSLMMARVNPDPASYKDFYSQLFLSKLHRK